MSIASNAMKLPMIAVSMTLLVMKAAIVESPGMIDGMMNFHVSQPDVTIMINAISALYLLTMSMIRLVILAPLGCRLFFDVLL